MTDEHVWDCHLILKKNKYTYLFKVNEHPKFKNKILKKIDTTPATDDTAGLGDDLDLGGDAGDVAAGDERGSNQGRIKAQSHRLPSFREIDKL